MSKEVHKLIKNKQNEIAELLQEKFVRTDTYRLCWTVREIVGTYESYFALTDFFFETAQDRIDIELKGYPSSVFYGQVSASIKENIEHRLMLLAIYCELGDKV